MSQNRQHERRSARPRVLISEFPALAAELEVALIKQSEERLAQTVPELRIYDEEESGIYTTPKQPGVRGMWRALTRGEPAWGKTHRNIMLNELDVVLDIVEESIAFIEFLDLERWTPTR